MRISTAVKRLRAHVNQNTIQFGESLGVSHVSVLHWERGEGVGPWSLVKLLKFAKESDAPADVIEVLTAHQPDEARP